MEGPLLALDPDLARFAIAHGLEVSKNAKDYPERSLRWGNNPSFLIQIYLENEDRLSWNLWLCCYEDRDDSRYWRTDFVIRDEPMEAFRDQLPGVLEESFKRLVAWGADPEQLEFVTKLAPIPRQ